MEIIGSIKKIGETKTFGDNGFRKREIIVLTEETYPQPISIEFIQDRCELINNFSENQRVKVSINLRGREWTNPEGEVRYFNSIQGWRIESLETINSNTNSTPPEIPNIDPSLNNNEDEDDDLPF